MSTDMTGMTCAPRTLQVLGIPFREMTRDDYEGLAGAEPGSYIAETDGALLVFDPATGALAEVPIDGREERIWQRN